MQHREAVNRSKFYSYYISYIWVIKVHIGDLLISNTSYSSRGVEEINQNLAIANENHNFNPSESNRVDFTTNTSYKDFNILIYYCIIINYNIKK